MNFRLRIFCIGREGNWRKFEEEVEIVFILFGIKKINYLEIRVELDIK